MPNLHPMPCHPVALRMGYRGKRVPEPSSNRKAVGHWVQMRPSSVPRNTHKCSVNRESLLGRRRCNFAGLGKNDLVALGIHLLQNDGAVSV